MSTKLAKDSLLKLNNGKTIPVSGFGLYQTPPDVTTKLTYEALKVGYRHIDSAKIYGNEAEGAQGIANFLKDHPNVKRSDIFFTTKIWNDDHGYELTKKAIETSLEKTQDIEYIDLFLIHSPKSDKEKRLGTWKALQEAVSTGKVKSIGVSNYGTKHLDELYSWDGLTIKPVINQVELHPWLPRKDLQKYAEKYDYLLEAYTPLTQAKKFDDPELVSIAKKHGYTPAQVLLRWSYAQGFIPLAKTATIERIKPNFTVLDDVELDEEDYKLLDKPDSYEVLTWDPTVYNDGDA
ncbi:hypothetical protein WICMUC_005642 [Wickerhamomyces mucosus]|uniref:NADP-dependent oxidoreductase domain-containing protein n=1 Tax=Wickerhamomyces mucosus TaxID=1378264 RepID=A0A9P8T530_9ASCO|nr:hypothetical protein WICMUC_005642 [Wickerhamomyces mucosus]